MIPEEHPAQIAADHEDSKPRMGRPPRGGTARRFRVVMTDEEVRQLRAVATAEGVPVSELIRRIAAG